MLNLDYAAFHAFCQEINSFMFTFCFYFLMRGGDDGGSGHIRLLPSKYRGLLIPVQVTALLSSGDPTTGHPWR